VAIGVTVDGHRDILGLWAGDGGEGAKFWLSVLTEIKNRGVVDVCIVVCDGLKGLPESISTAWPLAVVQACVLHYADVRIMQTRPRDVVSVAVTGWRGRHYHSASSRARILSGGR
jgi:transposase-like protein